MKRSLRVLVIGLAMLMTVAGIAEAQGRLSLARSGSHRTGSTYHRPRPRPRPSPSPTPRPPKPPRPSPSPMPSPSPSPIPSPSPSPTPSPSPSPTPSPSPSPTPVPTPTPQADGPAGGCLGDPTGHRRSGRQPLDARSGQPSPLPASWASASDPGEPALPHGDHVQSGDPRQWVLHRHRRGQAVQAADHLRSVHPCVGRVADVHRLGRHRADAVRRRRRRQRGLRELLPPGHPFGGRLGRREECGHPRLRRRDR